ncbi:tetratricopeptide repeat protein [Streptomyces noursei]|uniref:tetratricopeptide repeat protein n=1 Tax=Streptomyces noursei TaxID=1971 RepID=UPI0023D9FC4F|nr:tetratricopeptide repeat protein [Streptomyces noursei]
MDEELVERAARVIGRAAGTQAWDDVRGRLVEMCRRVQDDDATLLPEMPHGPDADAPELLPSWWYFLYELLEHAPGAETELRSLVDELSEPAPAMPHSSNGAPAAVRNIVSGGTTLGPVIQANAISGITITAAGFPGALPDPESWPTAADLDPIAFGVRPTHRVRLHPPLPPYVLRDRDHDLDAALGRAREGGGLVLLLGEPFTGKSRTALAAMARGPAGRRVFAPPRGTDLRGLPALLQGRPERYLIWLDDLDEHLGEGGLEPRLLAQLAALKVVVVATMREDVYDACRAQPGGRVLDVAQIVELAREWSPAERERLAGEAARTGDPRLIGAVSSSGPEGVAAYLALSPLLWDEWWRARRADRHPRGHALVRAALDLARCGLTGRLPMDLLLKVHEGYADVTGMERESADDARAWAVGRRYGLLRLLDRVTGDTWRAAPILVEATGRHEELPDVPGPVWGCALEVARTDGAYDYAEIAARARVAFQRAADAGDTSALHNLGLLADSLGEGDEAERWFRRAAEAGEPQSAGRLGRMLAERGEGKSAEPFLETAAEAGDTEAATLLGKLLRKRAARWLKAGMEGGSGEAAHLFGDLQLGRGDVDDAFDSYLRAVDAGYAPVAASMARVNQIWNDNESATVWLRRAADAGDVWASSVLADYVRKENHTEPRRVETVDRALDDIHYGAERGRALDATNLGVLLEERDRADEARPWYLKGYELGDAYGAFRLAELHKKEGDTAEATAWYRKAADLGHLGAKRALGESYG